MNLRKIESMLYLYPRTFTELPTLCHL